MNNKIYREVYVTRNIIPDTISYVQNTNALPIVLRLCDYDIPAGAVASAIVNKPSGKGVQASATINGNIVTVDVKTQMFVEVGISILQVMITSEDKILVTFDQPVHVFANHTDSDAPESENESSFFQELQNAADAANQAAQAANDAADNLTPEAIQNAVNNYLEENPVSGMTEEQEQQLQTNTENIKKIEGILNTKAPAIHQTAAGNPITLTDAGEGTPVVDFSVDGKTEQVQTTGAQLFDEIFEIGGIDSETGENTNSSSSAVIRSANYIPITPGESYTMTNGIASRYLKGRLYDSNKQFIGVSVGWTTNNQEELIRTDTAPENAYYFRFEVDLDSAQTGQDIIDGKYKYMFNSGPEALPYEPYTGGQPSPSPDYPQEIVNGGNWNEESQKWGYEVKVQGKNLIPFPYINESGKTENGITFTVQSDGGVKANGTATGDAFFNLCKIDFGTESLEEVSYPSNGKYVVSGSVGKVSVQYMSGNKLTFVTVRNGDTVNNQIVYPQMEYGTEPTPYEKYRSQTVLLQSDRPLTKWDRLEKRDGQWGWVFKSGMHVFDGTERLDYAIDSYPRLSWTNFYNDNLGAINAVMYMENLRYAGNNVQEENILSGSAGFARCFMYFDSTVDSKEAAVAKIMGQQIIYESAEESFIPLTESEQTALEALTTYFPTTIISNDADCEMEIEYVADTKTYIDNKFAELQTALANTQAQIL